MEILDKNLERCKECKRLGGYVEERYNGRVPVMCRCEVFGDKKKRPLPSPSIISAGNDLLMWTPTTDHKGKDGKWGHTPHFCGFGY